MPRMTIMPWILQSNIPCHTHKCSNPIRWRIVPDELSDVTAAVIAGLCDECKNSLLAGGLEQPVQLTVGWPEVDQFLRDHRTDPLAVPIVESALGVILQPPSKKESSRPAAKAQRGSKVARLSKADRAG